MAKTARSSFDNFQRSKRRRVISSNLRPDRDVAMTEAGPESADVSSHLIVAFDFGTTFSSVAYARVGGKTPRKDLGIPDVKCITRYPGDSVPRGVTFSWQPREDVPTELWYNVPSPPDNVPPPSDKRKLGNGISQRSDADSRRVDLLDERSDSTISIASRESSTSDNEQEKIIEHKEESVPLFWGFGVQRQLNNMDIPRDGARRLARFKLMLDSKNDKTKDLRTDLSVTLENLKPLKIIKKDTDVISDYLTQLFIHTKNELRRLSEYSAATPVEFVLCVPAVWPSAACRTMQAAMNTAAKKSEFGDLVHDNLNSLFIVSEPEAAAACVLAEDDNNILENEIVVILDAGGGTIDAVTYKVTKSHPLRLSREVIEPGTQTCGASFINEEFEKLLLNRLMDEEYLITNGKTIKSIVESKVMEFENGEKRIIDPADKYYQPESVYVDNLKSNEEKRFAQNRVCISKEEMIKVFKKSLDGTANLLIEQLDMAKAKSLAVRNVMLIGGFGQSPALIKRLQKLLATERNCLNQEIHFVIPRVAATVVARGAVLRALNKDHGPKRKTLCSYGILRSEPWQPKVVPAHDGIKAKIDEVDGEKYVDGTIKWLIKKGQDLPHNKLFSILVKHTFAIDAEEFNCKEVLYVSDSFHESHYRKTNVRNRGAEVAGSITADMTFLKTEKYIQPVPPSKFSTYSGTKAPTHWEVTFDLVMIIDGRNLQYEARWPPLNSPEASLHSQQVRKRGQICIAAAFSPGTR